MTRILALWERIRSSLWALPLLMIVAAAAAALLAMRANIPEREVAAWFLFSGSAKMAPEFLSDLVTSMITMATLVISITMVVLTLSAQQLGPRLIRSFMADWRTQATIGLFIGTVVYLLLVLRTSYGSPDEVANLAVTGGTALVLTSVVLLPVFVHHLARSIIADNVIEGIGQMLDAEAQRLHPEKQDGGTPLEDPEAEEVEGVAIPMPKSGYVYGVNYKSLVECACGANAVIALRLRAGHHGIEGMTLAIVTPEEAADDALKEKIAKCIDIGSYRSSVQDLEFYIRQLVEVAVRALSSGINDPYTAIAVVDRLTESLAKIMQRRPAKRFWFDKSGELRLITDISSFAGLVEASFQQIRENASRTPSVLIRLAESLGKLIELAAPDQRPALAEQAHLVLKTGRKHIDLKEDLADLESRLPDWLLETSAGRFDNDV